MKKAEAIIIAKRPLGEADELVVALTKDYGKVVFRARGVKKPKAKLAGSLQFLNWLDVYFVVGRGIPLITDSQIKMSFPAIKNSIAKMQATGIVCSTVEKATPASWGGDKEDNPMVDTILWEQILSYLLAVEKFSGKDSKLAITPLFFVYQMLSLHGFRPSLESCSLCGGNILPEKVYFSASTGGVVCSSCMKDEPTSTPISKQTLLLLRNWQTSPIKKILTDSNPPLDREEIRQVVEKFSQWHLGVPVDLSFPSGKIAEKV